MKRFADKPARNTLTIDAALIWEQTKTGMDEKCPEGWTGTQKDAVVRRFRMARADVNSGNAFQTFEEE